MAQTRLRVHVLGSGTCVPSLDRHPCSVLLEWEGIRILVDAGCGTVHRLLALGRSIDDLDAVFLSHFHLDHAGEVPSLLFSTNYPEFDRIKPLTLVGGTGLVPWFEGLRRAFGHTIDLPEPFFNCVELGESGRFTMGELKISYGPVAHRPESRAFRFETPDGFAVVYAGDTDVTERLVDLSRGADILICECAMPEGRKMPGHLIPSQAGDMAQQAGVKTLVLTHFYPACEGEDLVSPCAGKFSGQIVLARDLMAL